MSDQPVSLHEVTMQSVILAANALQNEGIEPETIDLPDLLRTMTDVAASRPTDGDGALVLSLLRLAALALLWSQSVDDLSDILAGSWQTGDADVDTFLSDIAREGGTRPALGEGSGDGS